MTVLVTDRLTLRPMTVDDIPRFLEFRNEPAVTRWLIVTTTDEDALRSRLTASDRSRSLSFAVDLDGVLIGTVDLGIADGLGQPGMPTATEGDIGYIFDPAFGGHGYASEATRAVVDHAFGTLGLRRLTAGCYTDNVASARVLEKVGMRREQHGLQDSWHAELGWIDGSGYGMLRSDWSPSQ